LSGLQLTVDGAVLERLAVERNGPFSATFVTRALSTIRGQDSGRLVLRRRFVGNGMREDLVLQNLASESRTATIELEFDADFAHIFDVKDGRRSRWPRQQAEVVPGGLRYLGERSGALFELMIQVDESAYLRPGGVVFQVNVPAKGEWASSVLLLVGTDGAMAVPHFGTMTPVRRAAPVVGLQS
jgi:glycogen debranching enzyme